MNIRIASRHEHEGAASAMQCGFTLIELMVAISILAILIGFGVPSFNDATLGGKLNAYANNFIASVRLARSEAIKRNANVTICVATNDTSTACGTGGWQNGWIVGCNTSDNITCNAAGGSRLVLYRQQALPAGIKMTDAGALVSLFFAPSGEISNGATVTVCRSSPVGRQERVINLRTTGRTAVTRTTQGSC